MTGRAGRAGVFALLPLGLFFLLRLPALEADPPAPLLSHYQDVAFSVFDEGWWTANARERILFGRTLGTGFDLFWVSPFFTLLATVAFSLGGVGLACARALSVGMGAGAIVLLGRMGGGRSSLEDAGARCARLAALLWAVAFAPAQLGRLALPETSGTALGVAGAAALLRGGRGSAFGAGVLAALATLTKPHFGFLLPALALASFALARRRGEAPPRAAGAVLAGAAVPLGLWGVYLAGHRSEAFSLMRFYLSDRWFAGRAPDLGAGLALLKPAAQVLVAGVVYRQPLFAHLPGIFLSALAASPAAWVAALHPRRRSEIPDVVLLFGIWIFVGGAAVSALPFQPLRYYLPLVPGLAVLSAWWLTGGGGGGAAAEVTPGRCLERLLAWSLGALALGQIVFFALHSSWVPSLVARAGGGEVRLLEPREFHLAPFLVEILRLHSLRPFETLPRQHAYLGALALAGAVAIAAGILAAIAAARPLAEGLGARPLPPRLRSALLAGIFLFQALLWVSWFPQRAWTLRDMGRRIDALIDPTARVSPGGTYSLESRLRFDSRAVRERRMFDATGEATHFVVLGRHPLIGRLEEGEIERRYPGSRRLESFELTGGYVYYLYEAAQPQERGRGRGEAR